MSGCGGGGRQVLKVGSEGQRRGSALSLSSSGLLRHRFTSSRGASRSSRSSQRDTGDSLSVSICSRSHALPGDQICLFFVDKFNGNSSSSSTNKHYQVDTLVTNRYEYLPKIHRKNLYVRLGQNRFIFWMKGLCQIWVVQLSNISKGIFKICFSRSKDLDQTCQVGNCSVDV